MKDPATLHAMIEDYRAAASIDLEHDEIDLDKKIECPLLVLWDRKGAMEPLYDVLATWRERAIDVRGRAFPGDETARRAQADTGVFPGGHWMPEEFPNELYDEVLRFFS